MLVLGKYESLSKIEQPKHLRAARTCCSSAPPVQSTSVEGGEGQVGLIPTSVQAHLVKALPCAM